VMAAHLKASESVIRDQAELELLRLHGTYSDDDVEVAEQKLAAVR